MSRNVFCDFAYRDIFERFTLALTRASRKAVLSSPHEKDGALAAGRAANPGRDYGNDNSTQRAGWLKCSEQSLAISADDFSKVFFK